MRSKNPDPLANRVFDRSKWSVRSQPLREVVLAGAVFIGDTNCFEEKRELLLEQIQAQEFRADFRTSPCRERAF